MAPLGEALRPVETGWAEVEAAFLGCARWEKLVKDTAAVRAQLGIDLPPCAAGRGWGVLHQPWLPWRARYWA